MVHARLACENNKLRHWDPLDKQATTLNLFDVPVENNLFCSFIRALFVK